MTTYRYNKSAKKVCEILLPAPLCLPGLPQPVHRTAVVDGDNKDRNPAVIDGKDSPAGTDEERIERHMLVAFEFLDARLRVLFCSKFVQRSTDAPCIFLREAEQIFLCPAGEMDCVHFNPVEVTETALSSRVFLPRISASPSSIATRVSSLTIWLSTWDSVTG